jgi:hypothetical protein
MTRLHLRPQLLVALVIVAAAASPVERSGAQGAAPESQANGAPLSVAAVMVSLGEVDLAWAAPVDTPFAGYIIRRNGQILVKLDGGTLAYTDSSVQPSMTYAYTVESLDQAGRKSAPSRPAVVKIPAPPDTRDTTPPAAPDDLTATITAAGYVFLDWYGEGDDTDSTAFRVWRNGKLLVTLGPGVQNYTDQAVQPATTYTYTVENLDVVGNRSAPSEEATATTPAWLPKSPAGAPAVSVGAAASDAAAAAPAAYASQLRRYPYLTDLVQSYVTVNWATDRSATSGSVQWGAVDAGGACALTNTTAATKVALTVGSAAEYQWKALLTLPAGGAYCYRVYLGAVDLLGGDASPRFQTQVPAGSSEPYSFAVVGDWGSVDATNANVDQSNIMALIAASGARFALTTGDNPYPSGSQTNYGDLVQTGADTSAVFGPSFWTVAGASIPLFPTIGNHGMSSSSTDHPHLLNWPQDRAVAASSGRYVRDTYCCLNGTNSASYPSPWYAFDAGPARFYVLDSAWANSNVGTADLYKNDYDYHLTTSSPEYQWLVNDLAAHPGGMKFAFSHFPLYSGNSSERSDPYLQGPSNLEGLLSDAGVNILFNGHSHVYTRSAPAGAHGLVSYVTGGGGAKLEPVSVCGAPVAAAIGWSYSANGGQGGGSKCGSASQPTSKAQVFHFLLVSVNGAQVTVRPTNSLGATFDVQTYTFGSGATATPTGAPPATATATPPAPATATPTLTATPAPTGAATATWTPTPLPTSGATATPTAPASATPTITATPPPTPTAPANGGLPIFSDGFESGDLSAWTTKGGLTVESTLVHSGADAAEGNTTIGGTYAKKVLPTTYAEGWGRVYFNLVSYTSQVNLLRLRTSTDGSLAYVYVTTAGKLALRNDAGATTQTSATSVGAGWHALELHGLVNGASGALEVWLDGARIADLSGTANLGTTPIGRLQIGEVQSGRTYDVIFDDAAFNTTRVGLMAGGPAP